MYFPFSRGWCIRTTTVDLQVREYKEVREYTSHRLLIQPIPSQVRVSTARETAHYSVEGQPWTSRGRDSVSSVLPWVDYRIYVDRVAQT